MVFVDTKKHRGKAVLEWNVATTYPPGKKPKELRKSAANGRDFVLCKETRPKAYCTYSEGVFRIRIRKIFRLTTVLSVLSATNPASTFGAPKLNFCVRNENRWILQAIVTTMVI